MLASACFSTNAVVPYHQSMLSRGVKFGLVLGCVGVLLGCGGEDNTDLLSWMQNQAKQAQNKQVSGEVPEIEPFIPAEFYGAQIANPFDRQFPEKAVIQRSDLPGPNQNRPREPLELYDITSINYTGSILKNGQRIALIKAEGQLYLLREGNYIGQDFGRIVAISDQQIELKEYVESEIGWVERVNSIPLSK